MADSASGPELRDQGWVVPDAEIMELRPKRTRYCVCVPVLNEGDRFRSQLEQMHDLIDRVDLLVLDGGSTDGSVEQGYLRERGVRTLLIKRGPGRLSAQLRMGYAYALRQGYSGIVTVDGNGKDGVDAIPRFLQELDAGADFVQGSRFVRGGRAVRTPRMRLLAIRLLHAPPISLAARFRYSDTTNGFRAYSRRLLTDERVAPFREVFDGYELLAYLSVRAPRLGYRTLEIPVSRVYPAHEATPTKIHGVGGSLKLMGVLFRAVLGRYSP